MSRFPVQNAIYSSGMVTGMGIGIFLVFLITKLSYFGVEEEPRLILGIISFVIIGLGGAVTFNLKKSGKPGNPKA